MATIDDIRRTEEPPVSPPVERGEDGATEQAEQQVATGGASQADAEGQALANAPVPGGGMPAEPDSAAKGGTDDGANGRAGSNGGHPAGVASEIPGDGDEDDMGELMRAWKEYEEKGNTGLNDLLPILEKVGKKHKPMTEEEVAKEKKKRKREAIFAAIGDGISALSNLYFTSQYAPNAHNPKANLSQGMKDRWDKLDKEREEGMRNYLNIALQKYGLEQGAAKDKLSHLKVFADMKEQRRARKAKEDADKAAAIQRQENEDRAHELKREKMRHDAEVAKGRDAERARHNRAMERVASSRSGGGNWKKEDLDAAYEYWDSLTDQEKRMLRNANQRKSSPIKDISGRVVGYNYANDDEKLIQFVYEQHLANERNIMKGGYGVDGVTRPKEGGQKPKGKTMPGVGGKKMPGVK